MPPLWFGLAHTDKFTAMHAHGRSVVLSIIAAAGLEVPHLRCDPSGQSENGFTGVDEGADLMNCLG